MFLAAIVLLAALTDRTAAGPLAYKRLALYVYYLGAKSVSAMDINKS